MTELPEMKKLDFSEFHPLDHWPFRRRCRAYYPRGLKSGLHHMGLAWEYKWSESIREHTLCRLGKHRWVEEVTYVDGFPKPSTICRDCVIDKP